MPPAGAHICGPLPKQPNEQKPSRIVHPCLQGITESRACRRQPQPSSTWHSPASFRNHGPSACRMLEHGGVHGPQKGKERQQGITARLRACLFRKVTWLLVCGLLLLAVALTWLAAPGWGYLRNFHWPGQKYYKFTPLSYERLRGKLPAGSQGTKPSGLQPASSSIDSSSKPRCLAEAFVHRGIEGGPWQDTSCHCLAHGPHIQPEPEFLSMLQPQSRTLPPRSPALAASNWKGQVLQRPQNWPAFSWPDCPYTEHLIAVKIYKGVLYSSPYSHDDPPPSHVHWTHYREVMYEMLVTVLWLYKDVPDMDLLVQVLDLPQHCNSDMPILQFAIFNQTSPATGERINVDPNAYVCWGGIASADAGCKGHTKGFTMPTPDAWEQLALSYYQLWWYSYCLHMRYMTTKSMSPELCEVPRKPVAFWRGSATGGQHGWEGPCAKAKTEGAKYLYSQLLNQRVSLALMADKYPWMDVGLNELHADEYPGWSDDVEQNKMLAQLLEKLLKGGFVDMEHLPQYHLVLNVDGHGPAFRLPRLFLGNVPVAKVDSIQRDWFIDRALPGIHYEAVRYDLSDVVERTRLLTQEAARNSSRLAAMALAATELGAELFNGLAQVESVAWSLARMKEACAWEVQPPENAVVGAPADGSGEKGWHVVKLKRYRKWYAPFLKPIKADIMQRQHHNFVTL